MNGDSRGNRGRVYPMLQMEIKRSSDERGSMIVGYRILEEQSLTILLCSIPGHHEFPISKAVGIGISIEFFRREVCLGRPAR